MRQLCPCYHGQYRYAPARCACRMAGSRKSARVHSLMGSALLQANSLHNGYAFDTMLANPDTGSPDAIKVSKTGGVTRLVGEKSSGVVLGSGIVACLVRAQSSVDHTCC